MADTLNAIYTYKNKRKHAYVSDKQYYAFENDIEKK